MRRRGVMQRGYAIVTAVFLLVVLAALGGYLAALGGTQHTTTALAVLGARAQFAARSGLEWAVSDIVNNAAGGLNCAPGNTSFTLSGGATAGFDVTVSCSAQSVTEGSNTYTVYNLRSTATRGSPGDPGFASRSIVATVAF